MTMLRRKNATEDAGEQLRQRKRTNALPAPSNTYRIAMSELDTLARALGESAPAGLDLADPDHQTAVTRAANALVASGADATRLASLETRLVADAGTPLLVHLAAKLARSRRFVLDREDPFHVSVVFAVYCEHERLLRPSEHANGEDFLRRKIAQMRWLLDDRPGFSWDLVVVDDGCPERSGDRVREVLDGLESPVDARVLLLEDAIANGHPVARALGSTDDSRKGGSIQLGMWEGAARGLENHVVVFTDADLSTHLGQVGLLVQGILEAGADAAIGSRREPTSVVIKKGVRNVRGKLFIYLWKRILPDLGEIVDTQCGFKAWRADSVPDIVSDALERGFAFDVELLLRTLLRRSDSIVKVPVAWFDSEAASTTTSLNPYLTMLRSIVAIARRYRPMDAIGERFAGFIESLTEDRWSRLIENVPAAIADREPSEFGRFDGVSVEDLETHAGA